MASMSPPNSISSLLTLALLFASLAPKVWAEISVPAYFTEHMMLQAGAAASVWGWDDPSESVSASFFGQTQNTQANNDGEWRVTFCALEPGSNGPLVLQGKTRSPLRTLSQARSG
jgi:sialate O-acetylesterase